MNRRRAVAALGGAWGVALLVAPRRVAGLVGQPTSPELLLLARVLGVRHLLESAALVATPRARRAVAAVDALHAVSMGAAAVRWPSARRAALTSGALATGLSLLTTAEARR